MMSGRSTASISNGTRPFLPRQRTSPPRETTMAMKDWLPATVQAAGVERALAPGQSLFRSGDRTAGIYEVLRGEVQMVRVDASGREIILYAASAGEIFAEAALFSPVYR